ncbi:hypothetical protein AC578_1904 [Pseudocercospora eumusae]|uniref:Zn(2)-C6 fungal-type domain-containing protein n=1 Tax=Pseudocercospora eumusae TaxID=321146 RepID=A0A139GYV4_9PEZI|nr:hypothetical protein AC578_1904 [Pseudocercospora eumusae]KXS95387.1 hypothetical protein AC578_1904 [Pseudocercospora eumusae]
MSTNGTHAGSKRSLSPDEEENHSTPQGRQRSRAACTPCRQRKRKCDGRLPCATCVRYEYQCEYDQKAKRASMPQNADVAQEPPPKQELGRTPPSIIQLQAHPLTAPGARFHHRGILDPVKTRFVRANSAIAFPRILGMDLESENIPRLHSFAWHLGIRPEPAEERINISQHISWVEFQNLASAYFKMVRPEFGLIDEADFMEAMAARFLEPSGLKDIDCVALGIAALGSFFSATPHPKEEAMFLDAKRVLVQRSIGNSPTPNQIAGWILRTIYLRLTSRPHGAWMSSCIAMHQVEASGLHKEIQTIAVVYPQVPTNDHKLAKNRRRLFWIARSLNTILSFEYGRTRVTFDVVTTKKFAAESGTHAHQFMELAELLPNDFVDRDREPDPPAALSHALSKIEAMQTESHFISLLKADLAFAIYRRLWLMSLTDAKDRADLVITIGKSALTAARKCLADKTPWWNVICTPFQLICVVISVGSPRSLSHIEEIMTLMHDVATVYDTHMVREAYSQATALIAMARRRKQKELDALNAIPEAPPFVDHPSAGPSSTLSEAPSLDWGAMDLPFEWDMFLNPELVVNTQQTMPIVDAALAGSSLGQFKFPIS